MKTKILLVFLLGVLATTGSTCINDGFLVAVNLPMEMCLAINPGSNPSFSGSQTIKLSDQVDASYLDKIKNARFYDLKVHVTGTYTGTIYNGKCYVNGKKLLDFTGGWADFATPQSLVGGSTFITRDTTGLKELVAVLNQFKTQPNTTVTLAGEGVLSPTPIPSGLSVCLEIFAQVDAEVK